MRVRLNLPAEHPPGPSARCSRSPQKEAYLLAQARAHYRITPEEDAASHYSGNLLFKANISPQDSCHDLAVLLNGGRTKLLRAFVFEKTFAPSIIFKLAQLAVRAGQEDGFGILIEKWRKGTHEREAWQFGLWMAALVDGKNGLLATLIAKTPGTVLGRFCTYMLNEYSAETAWNVDGMCMLYRALAARNKHVFAELVAGQIEKEHTFDAALMLFAKDPNARLDDDKGVSSVKDINDQISYFCDWQAWSGYLPSADFAEEVNHGPPVNMAEYGKCYGIVLDDKEAYYATLLFGTAENFARYVLAWYPKNHEDGWLDHASVVGGYVDTMTWPDGSFAMQDIMVARRWGVVLQKLGPAIVVPGMMNSGALDKLEAFERASTERPCPQGAGPMAQAGVEA